MTASAASAAASASASKAGACSFFGSFFAVASACLCRAIARLECSTARSGGADVATAAPAAAAGHTPTAAA